MKRRFIYLLIILIENEMKYPIIILISRFKTKIENLYTKFGNKMINKVIPENNLNRKS